MGKKEKKKKTLHDSLSLCPGKGVNGGFAPLYMAAA